MPPRPLLLVSQYCCWNSPSKNPGYIHPCSLHMLGVVNGHLHMWLHMIFTVNMYSTCQALGKATPNKFCFPSTARIWLLSALNTPLFRILLLFPGYSCILAGSIKLTCQQCYQVSTNFMFVLFLQFKKEGTSLSMLLCSFLWLYQANTGLKSCQSYNEIMKMDRPPARMQICLSPGLETENLFGVA